MHSDDEGLRAFRAAYPQYAHLSVEEVRAAMLLDDELFAALREAADLPAWRKAAEQVE